MVDIAKALGGAAQSAQEVEPNELVRKLMADLPSEILPFPRNGADGKPLFEYRMCILSQFELDGCTIDAERYTLTQFKDKKRPTDEDLGAVRGEAWTEVYNNSKIVEVLQRACRKPEVKKNNKGKEYYDSLFVGGDQIRKLLTGEELATLFSSYQNTQYKFGPLWRMLSADEVDSMVDKLEVGLSEFPLSHLEQGQLIVLVASLAARNRALRTDIGSSGLPADSGTEDTSAKTTDKLFGPSLPEDTE